MKLSRIATLIMIVAALLVPAAAAQGTGSHSYIVTPAGDTVLEDSPVFMPTNVGSITQGETDCMTNVAAGTTELIVDLNWGDSSDSLRLTVCTGHRARTVLRCIRRRERADIPAHKGLCRPVPRDMVV